MNDNNFSAVQPDRATMQAWADYVEAARKAQRSERMEDGIAAGKAWGRFLSLFIENDRWPTA